MEINKREQAEKNERLKRGLVTLGPFLFSLSNWSAFGRVLHER